MFSNISRARQNEKVKLVDEVFANLLFIYLENDQHRNCFIEYIMLQ
jgi:hypothetical protein